ncbi:hypothetical protein CLV59_102717 [Chitinophaga dinghuensis]|uniref:Uncharacterized protein n=1 Tax=Chitinophaga dinghuensis TaxID=1539050 RepID=A0A327W670_9BACT|nr:hypothetical protein [Chitinophaga dinghuensis]RAJ86009.1 hypothetical protein CLV59_102717 [Chitinophaga dinghuensis]
MKHLLLLLVIMITGGKLLAQTPAISQRTYYTNIEIAGQTRDDWAEDYILLHPAYNGVLLGQWTVMGRISAVRGGEASWNRKWSVEVNTSSSYNSDRGSLVSYNEPAKLVTLNYNGTKYLAIQIAKSSSLYGFSFTGWVEWFTLKLVMGTDVSNVQDFQDYDPITIPKSLVVDNSGRTLATLANPNIYKNNAVIINTSTSGMQISAPSTVENLFAGGHHLEFVSPNYTGGMGISVGQNNSAFLQAFSPTLENGSIFLNPNGGSIGIGVHDAKGHKLAVGGDIIAEKIVVKNQQNWPDFVFEKDYQLPSLQEVATYINAHKHLPEMPTAVEIKESGIDLETINARLLQKVEELTLYLIQLDKENKALKEEVKEIKATLKK